MVRSNKKTDEKPINKAEHIHIFFDDCDSLIEINDLEKKVNSVPENQMLNLYINDIIEPDVFSYLEDSEKNDLKKSNESTYIKMMKENDKLQKEDSPFKKSIDESVLFFDKIKNGFNERICDIEESLQTTKNELILDEFLTKDNLNVCDKKEIFIDEQIEKMNLDFEIKQKEFHEDEICVVKHEIYNNTFTIKEDKINNDSSQFKLNEFEDTTKIYMPENNVKIKYEHKNENTILNENKILEEVFADNSHINQPQDVSAIITSENPSLTEKSQKKRKYTRKIINNSSIDSNEYKTKKTKKTNNAKILNSIINDENKLIEKTQNENNESLNKECTKKKKGKLQIKNKIINFVELEKIKIKNNIEPNSIISFNKESDPVKCIYEKENFFKHVSELKKNLQNELKLLKKMLNEKISEFKEFFHEIDGVFYKADQNTIRDIVTKKIKAIENHIEKIDAYSLDVAKNFI